MSENKFEDNLRKLENIVGKLESGELSLEDSLKFYEEGIKFIKTCLSRLDEVEKKIEILTKDKNGKIIAKNFKPEDEKNTSF